MSKAIAEDESGVTLIELIVYVLLSAIIGTAVVAVLINSWNTQADVSSVTQATNRGQFFGSSIEKALRNARTHKIAPDGTTLLVRTNLPNGPECQGFAVDGETALLFTGTGAIPDDKTTWQVWQSKVIPRKDSADIPIPFFEKLDTEPTITYTFDIKTESKLVRFSGDVAARNPDGVSSPCW